LCADRGRFIYEVRPDIFPEGYLTDAEISVWHEYYREQNEAAKQNG